MLALAGGLRAEDLDAGRFGVAGTDASADLRRRAADPCEHEPLADWTAMTSSEPSTNAGGTLLSLPSRVARALALSIDRNILDLGRQMRLSVPAAADGLHGGRRIRPHRHRRHVLRQRVSRALGRLSRGAGVLGDAAVGAQGAAGSSGRSHLALQGRSGLSRRGADRGQPADHGGPAHGSGCDAQSDAGRHVVRVVDIACAGRLCSAGLRGRRHDGRSGAACRRRRASAVRRGAPPRPYHHADVGRVSRSSAAPFSSRWPT